MNMMCDVWYYSKSAILGPLGISDKPHQRGASLLNTAGAHLEVLLRSGTGLAAKDASVHIILKSWNGCHSMTWHICVCVHVYECQ